MIGATGQVGFELTRLLRGWGDIIAAGHAAEPLAIDLAEPQSIRAAIRELAPQWIINAAAYTKVDEAESDRERAMAVNGIAPGIIAEEAQRAGGALIHYSTDYVFDGTATRPYHEQDPTNPLNSYGLSKLAGDTAVAKVGGLHFIVRIGWVYGTRRRNFLTTIARRAREHAELRVVADQFGCPTWCRDVARATKQIIDHVSASPGDARALCGTYHLAAEGQTSWYEFAAHIVSETAAAGAAPRVTAVSSDEYPTQAKRPRYTVMSSEKFAATFDFRLPAWPISLKACLAG